MADFAQLNENNVVVHISVTTKEFMEANPERYTGVWVERNNANIGWTYNGTDFIAPQPYPSWTLDGNNDWQPPTPMPLEGSWTWNEAELAWVAI